jgi:hypothetical protein
MVLLAVIFVTTTLNSGNPSLVGMLAGLAPFLFAATVTYMKPSEPRFLYAAVLIGVGRGLAVLATLIAGQGVVRGDLANLMFDVVAFIDTPIQVAGVVLLGVAAGGVHSRYGLTVVGIGVLLAIIKTVWYFINVVPTLTGILSSVEIVQSLLLSPLFPIAWAFLVAAAFDARTRFLLLGSLVLLALEAVVVVLTMASPGPTADFGTIRLIVDVLQLAGWLLLALSPLRLEMGTQRPLREEVAPSR